MNLKRDERKHLIEEGPLRMVLLFMISYGSCNDKELISQVLCRFGLALCFSVTTSSTTRQPSVMLWLLIWVQGRDWPVSPWQLLLSRSSAQVG